MSGNKAVLFDMDGVIFDSERAVLALWQEIAGALGLPRIGEVFIQCVGTNKRRTEEIFLAAYPALDFHAFDDEVRRRFLARYDKGRLPVKPGAEQILRTLREKGVPLALASSTDSAVVRRELEEAGLLRYFDAVIGGDQVHVSKPNPEIFLLAAKALDADCSAVCYSGFGIVSGWSGDGTRNADMLLPPLYDVVAKGYEQAWDFSAHPSDVVVINLGTNDATYTGTDEARMREFAQGYEAFLSKVRERNPDAYIVCTMGTMGGHELYPYVAQAVADFRKQTGDERAMCYLSQAIDVEADGVGTNGHPNRASQQKCADRLVEVIRQVLGK